MVNESVRIGLIGAGKNTRDRHIPGFQSVQDVEIAAVANRSMQSGRQVADQFNIPQVYGNWQELLEDDSLDAVCIGTWPYMHRTLTLAALESGKTDVIPENKFIDIPARQIRKGNVDDFWTDLKAKVGGDAKNDTKEGKPRFAYVTNGVASFWTIASKGVIAAGNKLGVNTDVLMPAEGIADQKRMIEDLITRGVQGIAVSPIDAENQVDLLNQAAEKTRLITHDSDAPKANRLVYIGMDNYTAGRMCGELIREALPKGGKVMLFIGRLEQDNARLRRQGVIDALLGRSADNTRFDPADKVLEGR